MIERLLFRCRQELNAYREFVEDLASGRVSWINSDIEAQQLLDRLKSESEVAPVERDNPKECEFGTQSVGWVCASCGQYLGCFDWPSQPEGELCECGRTILPRPLLRPVE